MDNKQLAILKYLRPNGIGPIQDIAPLLLEFYPGIDDKDENKVKPMAQIIRTLLNDMEDAGFIVYYHTAQLGGRGLNNTYNWVSNQAVQVVLKQKGVEALEIAESKDAELALKQSMVDSNASVRATNKTVRITSRITAGFSAVLVFIAILTYFKKDTSQNTQQISKQLQVQDSILQILIKNSTHLPASSTQPDSGQKR